MVTAEPRRRSLKPEVRRYRVIELCYVLIMVVVLVRLYQLQVINHHYYVGLAAGQQEVYKQLIPERGQILATERDSITGETRPVPIAVNRDVSLVFADTGEITDAKKTAEQLAPLLSLKTEDLLTLLSKPRDPYVPLKQRLESSPAEQIKKLTLPGIYVQPEVARFYPNDNVGSHVTGFVRYQQNEMSGQYGVEGTFDKQLAGKPGSLLSEEDARGVWIALGKRDVTPAVNGADITLTLDWTLEYQACRALDAWVAQHGATGGSAIILDPQTGAVLAMCGNPDFNPNVYNEVKSITSFNNPSIFQDYEPGSVFKAITMAAALDQGKVTPTTTYNDTGEVKFGPDTIRNSDHKAHGVQTMTQVLDESLNTGAIFAMRQIGSAVFKQYVQNFGFGSATGIELSGEAKGNINSLNQPGSSEIYAATASFGQGISVTPLQMVAAVAAIANGGKLVAPHIVSQIQNADGTIQKFSGKIVRQVISEKTAALLRGMLVDVVENGHGKHAGVPGYYIAGKTGTAQIPRSDGKGYEAGPTIGSFVGFGPVNNPKFVMIVRIDRPKDVQFAESSAAPLFGQIAKFFLQYEEVPPERSAP